MRTTWAALAARIDEMTLRQRALLFATVSLVFVALAHAVLIEPVLSRQKQLIDRVNRDQSQLSAVRAQLQGLVKEQESERRDPALVALRDLEMRVAAAENTLAERKRGFVAPARLPALLRELLGPGRALRIEALRVTPGAGLEEATGLYRHGVELTVKGGYFELLQYLAELEKLHARLFWGRAELAVEQYPEVRLTVQVRTLSSQPSLGL